MMALKPRRLPLSTSRSMLAFHAQSLVQLCSSLSSLLKYGVAIVLTFIGIKLIIGRFYHVPASIVCVILVGAIAGSMVASVIQEKLEKKYEGKMSPEIAERVAKIKGSPFPSPAIAK